MDTVGVLAHRGGLLVDRPELTVGVVRAVSRSDGLEVELIARVPVDRLDSWGGPSAARHLLPAYDEGLDLRLGWLDAGGRARWEYPTTTATATHYRWPRKRFRSLHVLPPLFDEVSLVLAWPEIGFPETVVALPLPGRAEVDRDDAPLWTPGGGVPVVDEWERLPVEDLLPEHIPDEVPVETGTVVAGPVVFHGSAEATVTLARVTAVGPLLSVAVLTVARGAAAEAVNVAAFAPHPPDGAHWDGLAIAVVHGSTARRLWLSGGTLGGGSGDFTAATDFVLPRQDGPLDLLVSWPVAGLPEVLVRVELDVP